MTRLEDVSQSLPIRRDELGDLSRDIYFMYDKLKDTISRLENEILRVREMEEAQRYFFSAASHELKTPIAATSILLEGMLENVGDYKDHPKYLRECVKMMEGCSGTFKVYGKRSDKHFPMNSMEIAMEIGHRVLEANPNLTVDVHKPQHKLMVEIRDKAYICVDEIPAVGGLPMGTGGKAALLLSGGIDSPVAGYQMMKRGVRICAIHFQSPPYTGELAKDKVLQLAKKQAWYMGGMRVYMVPFTHCQLEIHEKCPDELGTLITRRFMMRIAERVAADFGAQALITGESLGQVASQTMEALGCTDAVVNMPVFRPLIGNDKTEIMAIAEKIDTFETSILPYEDCCTVFTPRHPVTKPKVETMPKVESKLDVEALVNEAVEGTEMIIV